MMEEVNQMNPTQGVTAVSPEEAAEPLEVTVEASETLSGQPVDETSFTATEMTDTSEPIGITLDDVVIDENDMVDAPTTASYGTVLAEKESEIQALKLQLEEKTSQFARIAADFDNFRKRTQREREELEQKLKRDVIIELLPVVDNFERARSHIKPQTDGENTVHKSYQSVYKQLVECLKRIEVAPMRAEGKEFDPALHEAVMREPTDEVPEGTVMEELQRGYLLGERVLRHALVKVAAAPDPMITSEENQESAS